jgi:muconolactone delta-isomerase
MEYLVTMTTHVPEGTSDAAVEEIRTRETAHSRRLAAEGHLLRLWRPPLQPGEWRTLGLFAAADQDELEEVLLSMPLRVWRTDEVLALAPHPNDPGRQTDHEPSEAVRGGIEFLTTFRVKVPRDMPNASVDATTAREADRARELAGHGQLLRLWMLLGNGHALARTKGRSELANAAPMASTTRRSAAAAAAKFPPKATSCWNARWMTPSASAAALARPSGSSTSPRCTMAPASSRSLRRCLGAG